MDICELRKPVGLDPLRKQFEVVCNRFEGDYVRDRPMPAKVLRVPQIVNEQ